MSTDERAVLGDELQQRGDPQGELIALQLALEALAATEPRARRNMIERRIATCLDQPHDALRRARTVRGAAVSGSCERGSARRASDPRAG